MSDTKNLKCRTHVRITSGRWKNCLGTILAVENDPNGTDYFVELANETLWVRYWDVEAV